MQLFYCQNIIMGDAILDESESKHCINVLRLKRGDIIQFTDGEGGLYDAAIMDPNPRKCLLKIISIKENVEKKDFYLHIAIAPTKNSDRFEWFAEKATEIGIDEITPVVCAKSERKIMNMERIEKVLISAMKQSGRAYLPAINNPLSFSNLILNNFEGDKCIAHCFPGRKKSLQEITRKGKNMLILIGPEGDFTEKEVDMAKMAGFSEISLGKSRLRTETAGIVACHIVNLMNE